MGITENQYNCIAVMEDVFKSCKDDKSLSTFYKGIIKDFLHEFDNIKESVRDMSMNRNEASKFIGKYMVHSKEVNKYLECSNSPRLRALENDLITLEHGIMPH